MGAITKYQEYKLEFKKTQISEYFLQHKDEEWFQLKYHPDVCESHKANQLKAYAVRLDAFKKLESVICDSELTVDLSKDTAITRLLDSAVIYMEGGSEKDLEALDMDEADLNSAASNKETESVDSKPKKAKKSKKRKKSEASGSSRDSTPNKKKGSDDESSSSSSSSEDSDSDNEGSAEKAKKNKEKPANGEDGEIDRKAAADSRPKPLHKTVSLFIQALPPKITRQELEEKMIQASPGFLRLAFTEALPEKKFFRKVYATFKHDVNIKEICWHLNNEKVQDQELATLVNKSIQLRVRPMNGITSYKDVVRSDLKLAAKLVHKLDCERGLYVPVQAEAPKEEKKEAPSNMVQPFAENKDKNETPNDQADDEKRDQTEAEVEWKQETEPKTEDSEQTAADISTESGSPAKTPKQESAANTTHQPSMPVVSDVTKSENPLLDHITDYLIEEVSAEEEELLAGLAARNAGLTGNGAGPGPDEAVLERDEKLIKVLDKLLLYLRIVHSIDFYACVEYANEDDMPSRISMMHARGVLQSSIVKIPDVKEYTKTFEQKMARLLVLSKKLSEEDIKKLGKKDEATEVENFVQANTKDLGDDKFLCPLSGKKFKGPDFVRKHIFNKHAEKVENVKKEVQFFNNFLADPDRPSLPDAPKREPRNDMNNTGNFQGGGGVGGGGNYGRTDYNSGYNQNQGGMYQNRRGGYYDNQGGGGGGMNYQGGYRNQYGGYNQQYNSPNYRGGGMRGRIGGGGYGNNYYGNRPQQGFNRDIRNYKDLDAPDDDM